MHREAGQEVNGSYKEIAMLVLTRKPNQQLQIGEGIVITVVRVRGNTIRLGIEAPKDVRIIRSELESKELSSSPAPKGYLGA